MGETELNREIGLMSGISMVVGTIIGSGIFVNTGQVLLKSGSIAMFFIVWTTCGLLATIGALTFVELGTIIPLSGGSYIYIMKGLGDIPAFLSAWISVLITRPAQASIICKCCAQYIISLFLTGNEVYYYKFLAESFFSAALLCILLYTNYKSVRWSLRIQNTLTWGKMLAIFIIIIGGFYNLYLGKWKNLMLGFEHIEGTQSTPTSFALAFYLCLFAFDGWNQLSLIVEEIQNPTRNLPLAICIGLPLVTILYVLTNISYLTVISPTELYEKDAIALLWARRVFNFWGLENYAPIIMALFVAMSTFGSANGTLFSTGRLMYSVGRNGHLPRILSFIHINNLTPSVSLIFSSMISVIMVLFLDIENLIDIFSFAQWGIYGSAFLSCIVLRWKYRDVIRPFKVWIIIPIVMTFLTLYLLVVPIITDPRAEYLYVIFCLSIGLVYYGPFVWKNITIPGSEHIVKTLQKVALITAPPDDYLEFMK
ncbi:b(0,+)-type amino acid transporter 1 [Lepeophtheirus salmonis]|uniref:b(0,+)-type amino acid transporter 1 n=1 Tax=Lepeophtheirus salmonis TaxID=72036 RepID=UPI001AE614D9|nr:b(0,+)-type amino acid transporter 1-like isoform X1 [Lepeophtheirus salmonis]